MMLLLLVGVTVMLAELALLPTVHAANILLLPISTFSHVRQISLIGEALAERGHNVHMVVSETFPMKDSFRGQVEVLTHTTPKMDIYKRTPEELSEFWNTLKHNPSIITSFRLLHHEVENTCTNELSDEVLIARLKDIHFDIAIVDVSPQGRCLLLLPYLLGIPHVSFETYFEPWLMRNPAFPSYVPSNMAQGVYTSQMTFLQRLDNFISFVDWTAFTGCPFLEDNFIQQFIQDKPFKSLDSLAVQSQLWLIDSDNVLDYPRPTMPNEVTVGGLTTKPASQLSGDLLEFINSAPDGVILLTFGSLYQDMEEKPLSQLLEVFRRITLRVVWRYPKIPPNLPDNVKIMDWLPQNDILGHDKTKLFITHCGANGQFEALYHGVPMIGLPIYGDQPYNCKRAVANGFARQLNLDTFTFTELLDAITEVTTNKSYASNIQRASVIFKDRSETPRERAAYWVEHVLKYGGTHLRAHALDMPWYQYLMVDIIACLLAMSILVTTSIAVLIYLSCTRLVLYFRGNRKSKKKRE